MFALAHSNLFIQSTLNGSCLDSQSGKVDESKLKQNLSDAIDVYISRVNKCPCADTVVHLYKESRKLRNPKVENNGENISQGKTQFDEKAQGRVS